ncbi:MobQ family relaxase [Tabrizicola oligotrophica]|uniref:MobA/MobL family protein n=1 Tax=Tabrizicola oligotrophica TaxID=2710650 RepID=A0A6M0QXM9_9RHOB|nr:MobQ family relaxase [Tabrizicola oligotrophica]NEY92220.1 MobA/MobL family protein [Tabrizicola oligotrophica]
MASYHLSVKTIKRSAGRSATAAAAYRSASVIECDREGRMHDYTAKRGVEACFILAPADAPDWAQDRAALWNAAEARETRSNSVIAREWELALPSEISDAARIEIARAFAQQLVERYGVAADVAIHAPHREGDQRNHHAHILTTTRILSAEGLTDKTRILDAASTGGPEIEAMRGYWAELQNHALEMAGQVERVDHRSLEAQREEALSLGDTLKAEELDREPEVKLGPAANAIERREQLAAEAEGREYEPLTQRGARVHAVRQAKAMFAEMRERLELARDAWAEAREEGQGHVSAGLAALRAAAGRQAKELNPDEIKERLARIAGRDLGEEHDHKPGQGGRDTRSRLADVLGKARAEDQEREKARQKEREQELNEERRRQRELDRDLGWEL